LLERERETERERERERERKKEGGRGERTVEKERERGRGKEREKERERERRNRRSEIIKPWGGSETPLQRYSPSLLPFCSIQRPVPLKQLVPESRASEVKLSVSLKYRARAGPFGMTGGRSIEGPPSL
jgi:hypothetical protein